MAEVAVFISTGSDPAIAVPGKGIPPKEPFACQVAVSGPAQKMRGTVVRRNGVLTRELHEMLPCVFRRVLLFGNEVSL